MSRVPRLLALAAAAVLAACDSHPTDGGTCTGELVAGLRVLVSDSLTGNAPAAVFVSATSGAFADTTSRGTFDVSGGAASFALAFEHAGNYTVTVTSPQFHPWTRSDVVVTHGSCHVNTTTVTARLQR